MRCAFCGHAPERHTLDGGCRNGCNCSRSLSQLLDDAMPTIVAPTRAPPIVHAQQPCLYCNATEIVARCAICGAMRETT